MLSESKKKLVIIGNGEFASVAFDYFSQDSDYQVVGFSIGSTYIAGPLFRGLPLMPLSQVVKHFSPESHYFYVAISYTQMNAVREQKYVDMVRLGYSPASYISSKAFISTSASLGEHLFIMEHVSIQPKVVISQNSVIWSGSQICHSVFMGQSVFVGANATIAGLSHIGDYSLVGAGSVISERVKVARNTLVGAGAVVIRDSDEGQVLIGNPAREK